MTDQQSKLIASASAVIDGAIAVVLAYVFTFPATSDDVDPPTCGNVFANQVPCTAPTTSLIVIGLVGLVVGIASYVVVRRITRPS